MTCVADAVERCGGNAFSGQTIWADCGGHFRSARCLAQNLVCALKSRPGLEVARLNFFAAGHGKGAVDAHFGHMGTCSRHGYRSLSSLQCVCMCCQQAVIVWWGGFCA